MRRWDRLVDAYLEEYRARGTCEATVAHTAARLARWGGWLKSRRPRPALEDIDADLLTRYLEHSAHFRAKATVYGTLSTMRGFGDYLVREGYWRQNPLRWMKGPKVTPYNRLPRRIEQAHMEAIWQQAARVHGEFSRALWVTVLALLYGTGLRRGELERLDLEDFDRIEATLKIDGRKTGRERCVPVSDLVHRCLEAYAPARHNVLERTMRRGERLTAQAISNAIHAFSPPTTRSCGVGIQIRSTLAVPNQNPQAQGTFVYNLRLPGQYYQAETGLNYNYFKDNDPGSGRYLESDPIGLAGGVNSYAYTGSNPISRKDQSGLVDQFDNRNPFYEHGQVI